MICSPQWTYIHTLMSVWKKEREMGLWVSNLVEIVTECYFQYTLKQWQLVRCEIPMCLIYKSYGIPPSHPLKNVFSGADVNILTRMEMACRESPLTTWMLNMFTCSPGDLSTTTDHLSRHWNSRLFRKPRSEVHGSSCGRPFNESVRRSPWISIESKFNLMN